MPSTFRAFIKSPEYRAYLISPIRHLVTLAPVVLICFLAAGTMPSHAVSEREPSPLTIKQIHSGHSLTDALAFKGRRQRHLASMINDIQRGAAKVGKSTIPGAPMKWSWSNAPSYGPDAKSEIGDWELLVITEGARLTPSLDSPQMLRKWAEHAWKNGNGGKGAHTLLYTNWTKIDYPKLPFRKTLDDYEPLWEEMADYASAGLPAEARIYIIPGHRLMMGLYDDAEAGVVPGISSFSEFLKDDIHPNGLGNYALALLHLLVVHHVDPRGLNHTGYGLKPEPSPALADYLQRKVWSVATSYERTGVVAAE